ncbi:hypothetical protein lerEdw1_013136 [Lerista edwardsae]|nr:hypothetical protein lerEdw1_013136 [Lerista edwardsae]
MAFCGSICSSPCGYGYGSGSGSGSGYICGPYSRGISSYGLVPVYGMGSYSGGGSGMGLGSSVSCTAQTPPSEVVIQPPPVAVIIPGATLSSSNEPVGVSYNSPCSDGYSGLGYSSGGLYGGLYGGLSGGLSEGYGRLGYGGWRGSGPCLARAAAAELGLLPLPWTGGDATGAAQGWGCLEEMQTSGQAA